MKKAILSTLLGLLGIFAFAQSDQGSSSRVSLDVETSLNDLITGGFSTRLYINTLRHWSIGIGVGNNPLSGVSKELVFDIEGDDSRVTTDLPFIVGLQARYFFTPNQRKFYAEASVGNEIFRVRAGDEVHINPNQFAVFSIGYLWVLKKGAMSGFYLNPRIGANFVWNDGGPRTINEIRYDLRPLFPNPGLQVGWRF